MIPCGMILGLILFHIYSVNWLLKINDDLASRCPESTVHPEKGSILSHSTAEFLFIYPFIHSFLSPLLESRLFSHALYTHSHDSAQELVIQNVHPENTARLLMQVIVLYAR